MINRVRVKATSCAKHIFNKEIVKDFAKEFLPRHRYLELKLEEICSKCPLHDNTRGHQNLSPSDREGLDTCRMRYFGLLLQSFVGKPGDEETKWLYSYLRRCEDCLLSGPDSNYPRKEKGMLKSKYG